MNTNIVRGVIAALVVAAVIGAYQIGKGAGERETIAEGKRLEAERSSSSSSRGVSVFGSRSNGNGLVDSDLAGEPSVRSIISKARAKMQGGFMNMSGMMRAVALLDQLTDEQIAEALVEIEKIKEPQQRMMFAMMLLGRWAESDGPAALAYAEEHFDTKNPMMMGMKSSVINSWAQNDPDAAWDWYINNKKDEGTSNRSGAMSLMGIFGSLAAKDVDKAFDRLAELEEPGERQMAMQGLGQAIWNEDSREQILAKIATLEGGERQTAQTSIISQWAQMDPDGALDWTQTLESKEERSSIVQRIGQSMAWSDPERAGEILLSNAETEEERSQAYQSVIGSWAHNDVEGASEWLSEQPQGAELDAARSSLASTVARQEPDSAMIWANSITEPNQRLGAVRNVYTQWRSQDEAAANAALDTVDLTAEQVTSLRNQELPEGLGNSLDAFGHPPHVHAVRRVETNDGGETVVTEELIEVPTEAEE